MNLIKCFQTHSNWYKGALGNSKPIGILWHDTYGGNPTLKRYVQPYEGDENYDEMIKLIGKNKYGNDWNHISHNSGVNAWIGQLADGSIATVQAGEWEKHPWGCGSDKLGSCNGYIYKNGNKNPVWLDQHWIQFEICDDGYKSEKYFKKVYKEACELTAYLCKEFDIDPNGTVEFAGITVPTIICHGDSHKYKLGCNHTDIEPWFPMFGHNMNDVRRDVAKLCDDCKPEPVPCECLTVGDKVKLKKTTKTYSNGGKIPSWLYDMTLYVRGFRSNRQVLISTEDTGDITGIVFDYDLEKINTGDIQPVEKPAPTPVTPPVESDDKLDTSDTKVPETNQKPPQNKPEEEPSEDVKLPVPETPDEPQKKEEAPEYIKTPEEGRNFLMKLLNHIIDFFAKMFKNKED